MVDFGMNELYKFNEELINKPLFIYGNDIYHWTMYSYFNSIGINIWGFITDEKTEEKVFGKPLLTLEEAGSLDGIYVLILEANWQVKYDNAFRFLPAEKIYVQSAPWWMTESECVACSNRKMWASHAVFHPFLRERMFDNNSPDTYMMHCPKCGMYFSSYRPSDAEMDLLYKNYRDKEYQQMRNKYDDYYTEEFNEELYSPSDGGKSRMDAMVKFIQGSGIDIDKCEYVLDFGGDKGQFIPPEFTKSNRYVYEISNPQVVEGVTLITNNNELQNYKWDIIFCNMVMEHLSDIKSYFRTLVSYMNENTFLYVEVPYERQMVDASFSLVHEHINSFGDYSFYELAIDNNISLIKQDVEDGVIRCLFIR